MQRFRFPIAVAFTSLALVGALVAAGGLLVGNALALGPFSGSSFGPWGPGYGGWPNAQLPPQLAGLIGVPAGERFAHFRGVHVQLTDKDNNPLTVDITPGTATTISPTSLTIAANDGSARTFMLDARTLVRDKSAANDAGQATPSTIRQGEQVIVATLNNGTTATAVVAFSPDGAGPHGPWGR